MTIFQDKLFLYLLQHSVTQHNDSLPKHIEHGGLNSTQNSSYSVVLLSVAFHNLMLFFYKFTSVPTLIKNYSCKKVASRRSSVVGPSATNTYRHLVSQTRAEKFGRKMNKKVENYKFKVILSTNCQHLVKLVQSWQCLT